MALTIQWVFRELMEKNRSILLSNHFNGVTVANHATILGFNRASVKVGVNKYLGVVLQQEHETLMATDICTEAIFARVDYVNLPAREAYLTDFHFVEKLLNLREQVRISPRQELEVTFPAYPEIKGIVHDLSFDGMGFYIPREDSNYEKFEKGKQIIIHLSLSLGGEEKKVELPGEIKKIILLSEESRLRIGVKTMADAENRAVVSSYISHNLLDICSELDTLYSEMVQEPILLPKA